MKHTLLVIFCIGCIECFGQAGIYWAETGKIRRADLDGTNATTLVAVFYPRGVAVDTAGGKIYWTDIGTKKIQRANLDGSNVQDLVDSLNKPYDIALDVQEGKMYWTDYGTKKVQRADFDGTNTEDLVTGLNKPLGISLDTIADKMYWVDNGSKRIQRADLDGSGQETLIQEIVDYLCENPYNITVDMISKDYYWVEKSKVWRDNGNLTVIAGRITGLYFPYYIHLDLGAQKLYITDSVTYRIVRMDFDGMNAEDLSWIIGFTPSPQGIAVIGDIAIGLEDVKERETGIKIYPNPTKEIIHIKGNFTLPATIVLYDLTGRKVLTQNITSNQPIHIGALAQGLYFISLKTNDKQLTRKLVVNH